jgi:serine/threonine-protein kinase
MLWMPGQILKTRPFRIESILGQGGFGITYKATHLQLNHQVVLKTPNAGLQNDPEYPKFVDRFIREGQILAKLSENAPPGIVRVSDLFEENGIHCLVMDLVVGPSLFEVVQQRGRLPDTEAVEIIRQIGEALTAVHQAGLVHRDAHPGNIMLRPNGQAVLIDFGIATELVPMVPTSKHFAHRDFAPWEQRKGSGKPTVDIYALAASLYYAVTGEKPTPSFERQFENEPLPPAKDFGVKYWVSQAIEKGMDSDPQKRPQSMQEWLTYLREPTISSVSVQLNSARGVDYTRLRDLLAAGKWKEADLETLKVMLKATRREKEHYFTRESIDNFPCDDLRTIDQLWVEYSQGHFGFSVQKKIWLEVGGKDDNKAIGKLGYYVGWRDEHWHIWLRYKDLTFNMQARYGHLPGYLAVASFVLVGGGTDSDLLMGLLSRIENCNL